MTSNIGYTAQVCAKSPKVILYVIVADRLIQAALIALALTGVINKTGFLIGTFALTGAEALALGSLCSGLGCCDKAKTISKWAAAYFALSVFLPLICLTGGMNYKACAWSLAGFNIFCLSALLINYGIKKHIEDKHALTLKFC